MSVLHAALLQPIDNAYDYKNCTIDEGIVTNRLQKVKEIYGSNLFNFLTAMLIMNAEDR